MKKLNISFEKIMIVIGLIMIIYALYNMFFSKIFKNSYQKIEEEMIVKAKEYVNTHNINTSKEIYIDVNTLNIKLNNNCSIVSGVLYDGKIYKPYLSCSEYKSTVVDRNIEEKEYITLKGEEVIVLNKGMLYYEPGYTSKDSVIVSGNIGTEEGVYNIFYKTKNSNHLVVRKVIIINNNAVKNLFPIFNLKGEEIVYLIKGNNYQEPGYDVYDQVDGNIKSKVKIENNINNNYPGEYLVSYIATNSRGYTNGITRTVYVINKESDLVVNYSLSPNNMTNKEVTIKLNINNDFNYILYPNGQKGKDLLYTVTDNGKYTFHIYDTYGRETIKEIQVNNIDKTIPKGTCIANLYNNKTEVIVTMSTKKEISKYEYIINGNTHTMNTNKYISSITNPSSVKVKVVDIVNNVGEIDCTLKNNIVKLTGSCTATMYNNKTEIQVSSSSKISKYQYTIDGKSYTREVNKFTSSVVKPSKVSVKIKDTNNNIAEIKCSLKNNITTPKPALKIVTDSRGKNCLQGKVCYVQDDFSDASHVYCSLNQESSCGTIGSKGCSLTSVAIVIASGGGKSKNGKLFNPWTVLEEIYPVVSSNGYCDGGCSLWHNIKRALSNVGLSTTNNLSIADSNAPSIIMNHLKKGYPVIVWAKDGAYTYVGHYMVLLSSKDDKYVFLSDPANNSGTFKKQYNGRAYYVDTWVPISDLITGNVKEYVLVGPNGMF